MTYRDIVVDACPRSDIYQTLDQSRAMAREFGANLSVVSYAWPHLSMTQALAPNALSVQEQTRAMEDALSAARSAFEEVFAASPEEVEWCSGINEPTGAMRDHLLTADLLITSSSEADACVLSDPADLARRSGTPVLRLGRQAANGGFPNVLIAWKDCSQARRALHDALPLLERAKSVAVVGVGDEVSAERLEAVARHLRHHQVKADHRHLPRSREDVCAELLDYAEREGANLIVAGVYSHGPTVERILGGVTREILKSREMSWFLAH
ncbi:universal stress protein [Sphingopyxis alaskensis]|uniref:UspA n=1 Tax=Sphingopyxis alaskensis (strain DSM 13593 / LMG 18877 / RB2256) TaxID=317655 RepID=Q1GPZ2_SPHAL|nr:universal stress protein [Sphingopyxis alaskensis]ABF54280.1 UspA [Sphingopyxis alaskensis RB2256]MCM3418009.1 universal stress protein [Sphingopyxis alaskensis]